MKQVYAFDDNGYFLSVMNCQLDPLETKKQKREIYILPANSTEIKTPRLKKNQRARFSNGKWTIEEIPEITQEQIIEKTEREDVIEQIQLVQNELAQYYNVGIEIATEQCSIEKYRGVILHIKELTDKIKELKLRLNEIDGLPAPNEFTVLQEKQMEIRFIRNKYLDETDKKVLVDYPISEELRQEYKEYRTYLRDYTLQENWWLYQPYDFETYKLSLMEEKPYTEDFE